MAKVKSKFKRARSPFEVAGQEVTQEKRTFVRPGFKKKGQMNAKTGRFKR